MKINVEQTLKTLDGQVMKDNEGGVAVDATVKMVIVNAILSPVERESGVDKVRKYELAKKVYAGDEVDLSAEEITLIKERIGEVFPPIITGQVWEILEGKNA